jgi:hypothetical protein
VDRISYSFDQFAAFAEIAKRGMQTTLEFSKSLALGDLDTARPQSVTWAGPISGC